MEKMTKAELEEGDFLIRDSPIYRRPEYFYRAKHSGMKTNRGGPNIP